MFRRTALDATQTDALITDEEGVILFVTKTLGGDAQGASRQNQSGAAPSGSGPSGGPTPGSLLTGRRWRRSDHSATSDVETELRFAGLTFALRAQAVRDRKLEVAGHVIIWRDLTATLTKGEQDSASTVELVQIVVNMCWMSA